MSVARHSNCLLLCSLSMIATKPSWSTFTVPWHMWWEPRWHKREVYKLQTHDSVPESESYDLTVNLSSKSESFFRFHSEKKNKNAKDRKLCIIPKYCMYASTLLVPLKYLSHQKTWKSTVWECHSKVTVAMSHQHSQSSPFIDWKSSFVVSLIAQIV